MCPNRIHFKEMQGCAHSSKIFVGNGRQQHVAAVILMRSTSSVSTSMSPSGKRSSYYSLLTTCSACASVHTVQSFAIRHEPAASHHYVDAFLRLSVQDAWLMV